MKPRELSTTGSLKKHSPLKPKPLRGAKHPAKRLRRETLSHSQLHKLQSTTAQRVVPTGGGATAESKTHAQFTARLSPPQRQHFNRALKT